MSDNTKILTDMQAFARFMNNNPPKRTLFTYDDLFGPRHEEEEEDYGVDFSAGKGSI